MGTLILTEEYCPNGDENREKNTVGVFPNSEEVMCDTEHMDRC